MDTEVPPAWSVGFSRSAHVGPSPELGDLARGTSAWPLRREGGRRVPPPSTQPVPPPSPRPLGGEESPASWWVGCPPRGHGGVSISGRLRARRLCESPLLRSSSAQNFQPPDIGGWKARLGLQEPAKAACVCP